MATTTASTPQPGMTAKTAAFFAIPLVLLVAVIALFVWTDGAGLSGEPAAPIEAVEFGPTRLETGIIELNLRNTGPKELAISQINVNDAIWPYTASRNPIARLGNSTLTLHYPWVEGEAYRITVFTGNSVPLTTTIEVATTTKGASASTLWSFTLVGIYVGIIPIVLGMLWIPALRRLSRRTMLFLMAATVGLLIYLGINAIGEALDQAATLGEPFQGKGLIGIGVIATFLLLEAVAQRQSGGGRSDAGQRLTLAAMIALGIGLHNLGEGLAIGAAYRIGAQTLGTFLVVGFILQNITEGLGIVVPILKDRPRLRVLALLGLLGGGPAIVGAWIGGLVATPVLAVLFLAIGAGAVFQVAYAIGKQMVWREPHRSTMPLTIFSGVTAGMLALYLTGLAIK